MEFGLFQDDNSIPFLPEFSQEIDAKVFMKKTRNALIWTGKRPLMRVAMLENSVSLKVVLTHYTLERFDGPGRHGVRQVEFPKRHMERVFITVNKVVVKIGMFIVPHA